MKKLIFLLFFIPTILSGQKTADVLGHHFAVGDSITLTKGKMPNGDYVSIVVSSKGFNSYHFPSGGEGMKFAIDKIKTINDGGDIVTCLCIKNGICDITVIANTAIEKKEIILK